MGIEKYLGKHVSVLLQEHPFENWLFKKSVETDLEEPIVQYVFKDRGLELRCDQVEKISVIFLSSDECHGFDEALMEFSFSWKREQILGRFGTPSKSGQKMKDPILGEYGNWDRFDGPDCSIH